MTTTKNAIRLIAITILIQVFVFAAPHSSPARGKAYIVGARDVLSITIYAGGELQQEVDLTVSAKGIINAPFVGAIKAVGLTLPRLEERIPRPLANDYFV
ncbi:MAG: polysaccharide biosynthesis/export family protein, partial [Deltaproteobacteria bacterium]|nr:polysaccharide biosynthesis/export family protein [Deltaproteobacteria bacterium]